MPKKSVSKKTVNPIYWDNFAMQVIIIVLLLVGLVLGSVYFEGNLSGDAKKTVKTSACLSTTETGRPFLTSCSNGGQKVFISKDPKNSIFIVTDPTGKSLYRLNNCITFPTGKWSCSIIGSQEYTLVDDTSTQIIAPWAEFSIKPATAQEISNFQIYYGSTSYYPGGDSKLVTDGSSNIAGQGYYPGGDSK